MAQKKKEQKGRLSAVRSNDLLAEDILHIYKDLNDWRKRVTITDDREYNNLCGIITRLWNVF